MKRFIKKAINFLFLGYLLYFASFVLSTTPTQVGKVYAQENKNVTEAIVEPSKGNSAAGQSNEDILRTVARGAGLSDWQIDQLVCIGKAESGLRSDAVNRANKNKSVDYGVLQINWPSTAPSLLQRVGEPNDNPEILLSPFVNIKAGVQLYKERGPQPWSVYSVHGACH